MTKAKGEIFKDKNKDFRGRVKSSNGRKIAVTEGYENRNGAENALKILGISKRNMVDKTKKTQGNKNQ